jgi:hypothetical protein
MSLMRRIETSTIALFLLASGCSDGATSASSPGVVFAASGEVLALTGYAFPPATADDPAFVDGWEVTFDRLLVTIDKITLSANPDKVQGDQAQTDGVVAEVDGPWAVDLHKSDPSNLQGKGGADEQAVPLVALANQNKNGGAPFPADGTRYAFGFDVVPAAASAKRVNLDAAAAADYDEMIQNGCTVFYAGTATFKGDKMDASCYPPDRTTFPDVVNFRFCFKTPTTYVNCQNPDNDPAKPFADEEHVRGIAFESSRQVVAQVTIHTDHPFWDSVLHESPAHFDQFAARVVGQMGTPTVKLEDTVGVDYSKYVDAMNQPLAWRYCIEPSTAAHPKLTGEMAFDPQSVPHATGADPATGLRDYYDFAAYNQSTQGHLNSDGLCFVKRNYPSPD